mgnify:CR=1 FL=1
MPTCYTARSPLRSRQLSPPPSAQREESGGGAQVDPLRVPEQAIVGNE